MNTSINLLAATLAVQVASVVSAQGLLLQVDRSTGVMTVSGTGTTAVSLGGYEIKSGSGSIDQANFDGVRNDVADWVIEGTPDANGVAELLSNASGATPVTDADSYSLGAAYDDVQAKMVAGFGVDIEANDLSLSYYDAALRTTLAGSVEYLGEKQENNIGVTVDLSNGTAIIENESPFNQVVQGYLIETSSAGSLNMNLSTFDGLRDEAGGADFSPPPTPSGNSLGELAATGAGIALDAGQFYSLGTVGGGFGLLSFSFVLEGADEFSRVGFVKYINVPMTQGDFNGDGVVDAADYTLWRDNLGALDETAINGNGDGDGVSQADYNVWRDNYGAVYTAASTGASPTPEPAAIALTLLAAGGFLQSTRSRENSGRE